MPVCAFHRALNRLLSCQNNELVVHPGSALFCLFVLKDDPIGPEVMDCARKIEGSKATPQKVAAGILHYKPISDFFSARFTKC